MTTNELALELEREFGDRAVDGLWCNVPAKTMLRIIAALRPQPDGDEVERVARAIVPILSGSQEDKWGRDLPDLQYDNLTPDWQQRYREYAQAAIAAMPVKGRDEVLEEAIAKIQAMQGGAGSEFDVGLVCGLEAAIDAIRALKSGGR